MNCVLKRNMCLCLGRFILPSGPAASNSGGTAMDNQVEVEEEDNDEDELPSLGRPDFSSD